MSRILRAIRSFRSSTRGNSAVIFALTLVPLIGLVGLGMDYGVAITDKTKLDNAADAAAIAAVTTAKAYVIANPTQSSSTITANAIAAGIAKATSAFSVNAGNVPFAQVQFATPVLTRTKQTFSSTVSYTASVTNHAGQLFKQPVFNLSNTVGASADVPSYLDFYLLVDVSGSMGLPSTPTGMTQLSSVNTDMYSDYNQGCQFACHFPGNNGWNQAAGKIQLRSDAVNSAVCSLIQRASTPAIPNQYRIGLYPFINQMGVLTGLTASNSTLYAAAQCGNSWPLAFTNLLDTGTTQLAVGNDPTTGTGSGGTHFEVVFPQMQSTITSFGDGSSASASKPFVFLITDGMENSQHYFTMKNGQYAYPGNPSSYAGYANAWWDGSNPSQIDPTVCTALKNAGATVSILYIPYNIINFTNYGGTVAYENNKVNSFSPSLSTPLQSCASSGFFYTANSPADITSALNAMFNQAVQVAHLTR